MLRIISEHGTEHPKNGELLTALTLGAVKHLGGASAEIEDDGGVR
jgi:hypothetical protein